MTDETAGSRGPLPEGTRLLHVGPHKTGTTSLQAALWAARPAMLAQGVRHVGRTRNPATAIRAITEQRTPTSDNAPTPMRYWRDIVLEFRRARESRAVLSSELFAWATPEVIHRVARDLDGNRLHVVVTLRPLGRILPSQWQQDVQAGTRHPYEAWLQRVFSAKPYAVGRDFWQLHRHDELVARWAAVLGRDRVTAVVVDERDHEMLLRVFGDLLGLREGTLAPDHDLSNRSLTLEEVEAVRAFNVAANDAGVGRAVHAATMRFGAAIHMKLRAPGPDEPRIDTPQWALDRAREVDAGIVEALAASGVRIIGDLASLARPLTSRGEEAATAGPILVPTQVAAEMAMGIALASGLARSAGARSGGLGAAADGPGESPDLARVSTWQLAATVKRRTVASGTARVRRLRGRAARTAHGTRAPKGAVLATAPLLDDMRPPMTPAAIDDLPGRLPDGTRLLHIGPPERGTGCVNEATWTPPEANDRVVGSLDPARTHVLVTLLPLGGLMASEWQEGVQDGLDLSFDAWLHTLFDDPSDSQSISFWRHGRYDQLIERWAARVGPGNVTAIVVDDHDQDRPQRVLESLGGLRTGTLAQDRSTGSRSLTLAEISAIRAMRERWVAEGLGAPGFQRIVRPKVATHMRTRVPGPDESWVETPRWALDRVAGLSREIVAGIAATGVRVIGDVERLVAAPRGTEGDMPPEPRVAPDLAPRVAPELAASMAMGVLVAAGATSGPGGPGSWIEPVEAARIPTRRLAQIMARRAVRSVTRRGTRAAG